MQTSLSNKTADSSSFHKEINKNFLQESELPPPPYKSEFYDECLPRYMESSPTLAAGLEDILDRFAPRWDDQCIVLNNSRHYCNSDMNRSYSTPLLLTDADHTGQLLDRMKVYRHTDQDWMSLNQPRMNQVIQNMYHIKQPSSTVNPKKRQSPYLSSAKSKYQKMTLSIVKERDHFIQKIKNLRPASLNPASCDDEFHFFLAYIHETTSQSQMSNQRATIIPTI